MVRRAAQHEYRRIEPDVGVLSCASASRGADAAQVTWHPKLKRDSLDRRGPLQFSPSNPALDGMEDPRSIPPPERTMWRIPGLSVLHLLLPLGSVAAQLCAGVQSFAGRPVQLWGFGTFTSGSHLGSYGGGVRLIGGRAAVGDVGLGASHTAADGGASSPGGAGAACSGITHQKGTVPTSVPTRGRVR